MNTRRVIGVLLGPALLALLAWLALAARPALPPTATAGESQTEAPQAATLLISSQLAGASAELAPTPAPPQFTEVSAGGLVTQTFSLKPGWNTIYLGVEPVNPSRPVNQGAEEEPLMVHEKTVAEAVFGVLPKGALDSVWTNVLPVSRQAQPARELWNEAGWLRYVPESNKGPDGKSRAALTNLHTLHANTGYLVKMNTAGTVEVWGKPILGHQRLQAGAYDLVGFPIGPGHAPSAGTFLSAESPFAEISALKIDGTWTVLWKTAKLAARHSVSRKVCRTIEGDGLHRTARTGVCSGRTTPCRGSPVRRRHVWKPDELHSQEPVRVEHAGCHAIAASESPRRLALRRGLGAR